MPVSLPPYNGSVNPDFDRQIEFVLEIDKLKQVLRQTRLTDGSRQENSAEHSWHLAMMATVMAGHAANPVKVDHVIRMALVHDLVEIDAGDTFAYDDAGNQSKAEREQQAADRIFSLLPPAQGHALRALWEEFEEGSTAEAQFAAALDRLQPLLHNWRTRGASWRGHGVRKSQVYERMEPVRLYLPAAWPLVCSIVEGAATAGWLQEG